MPQSGIFINLGSNSFLLFNSTWYSYNGAFNANDGYPFPLKLSIKCTYDEQVKDYKTIKELIVQIYQFSRMYWKSVRQKTSPSQSNTVKWSPKFTSISMATRFQHLEKIICTFCYTMSTKKYA